MYLSPIRKEISRRLTTPDGEFTLYNTAVVKLPDGTEWDLNELLDEPVVIDHKPGNTFHVSGDILFIAGMQRDQRVSEEQLDTDDEDAHHSTLYVGCFDWRTKTRVWDRTMGLGGCTALTASNDALYIAGYREYPENPDTNTVMARIDASGSLTWLLVETAVPIPHPTEVELRPDRVSVYVDGFNTFLDTSTRVCITLDLDGHVQTIRTLNEETPDL